MNDSTRRARRLSVPVAAVAARALLAGALLTGTAHAAPLTIEEAIRAAWARNPALRASAAGVEAAREDAARARDGHLPTISLQVRGVRTDEPMMAFGLKLDQARIAMADFDPARLNDPAAIGGFGAGATLTLPIFLGGRVEAGRRAAGAMADAEAATDVRRRQEIAVGVVQAYFGAQAAEEGLRYAEDLLAHAQETERFVAARNRDGLALDADLARATAFRAQAEAEKASAVQRLASARSALALLAGDEVASAELTSALATSVGRGDAAPTSVSAPPGGAAPSTRPDLEAARLRRDAAEQMIAAARGSLLPMLVAQASAETMRTSDLADGKSWTTLGFVLRWDLAVGDLRGVSAARLRAQAAADALAWQEREAAREGGEAGRAVQASDARERAANEAVAAATSARTLRLARHRQGLLPLTDVLDAEAALAGARALLLASRLDARVARARLALAQNQPIEGLVP